MPRGAMRLLLGAAAVLTVAFAAGPRGSAHADDDFYPDAYPVGVAAVCDGRQLEGATLIQVTSAPGSLPVSMVVYLDYISLQGTWVRVAKKYAEQNAVVSGSTDWSVNFTVPLDGLPATTTTVRPVIEVKYPDMDGGQTVVATELLDGPATSCPAVAPDTGDPWTLRYEVRLGDSLGAIAARYGLPVASLSSTNGLGAEQVLYVGQMLTIPPKSTPTPVAPTSTPQPPSSVGLGSPAHATATPRVIVATPTPGAKTATPEPTATATTTPTASPTLTGTVTTPTATATGEGGAAVGAIVPPADGDGTDDGGGSSPLSILDKFVPIVFVLISLVALAGFVILFRIWREGRAPAEPDIEREPIVRLPRAAEATPAALAPFAQAAESPSPLAAPPAPEAEDEPLPSALRDVFSKAEKKSVFDDVVDMKSPVRSAEVLDDAERLVATLRRRRAG